MSKYLAIGTMGFLMGMKYRQLGRRKCMFLLKKQLRRLTHMP